MAALTGPEHNDAEIASPRVTSAEAQQRANNGRRVAIQLELALTHLRNAQATVDEAKRLIETDENEPNFLMGQIPNLSGMLELAQIATRREHEEWDRMATARERF